MNAAAGGLNVLLAVNWVDLSSFEADVLQLARFRKN
jgi:hypothetical protein